MYENLNQIIKRYTKRVTKTSKRIISLRNCRGKNNCPMNGNHRIENIVHKFVNSTTEKSNKHGIELLQSHHVFQKYTKLTWSVLNQNI